MEGFGPLLKDYLEYYKISQTDFAERLGITKKHLNNLINGKANISEELMIAISLITDIDINLIFFAEKKKRVSNYLYNKYKTDDNIKAFLNSYYINDISKKGWITLKDKTSNTQKALDLLEYLNVSNFDILDTYLDNKILYKKRDNADMKKIYLWIKHCDKLVANTSIKEYNPKDFDKLLDELKFERLNKFNQNNIIKLFNKYGIYLVIEDALPSTKIRGCMMVKRNNPAIYLTKLFKDKASFYFALYHELAHVKSDYNKAKNKIVIDNVETEVMADNFALDNMITKDIYEKIKNNINNLEKICEYNKIPVCFATSRLAKDGIISYSSPIYNKYREII